MQKFEAEQRVWLDIGGLEEQASVAWERPPPLSEYSEPKWSPWDDYSRRELRHHEERMITSILYEGLANYRLRKGALTIKMAPDPPPFGLGNLLLALGFGIHCNSLYIRVLNKWFGHFQRLWTASNLVQ